MECAVCGESLADDAKSCAVCGTAVLVPSGVSSGTTPATTSSPATLSKPDAGTGAPEMASSVSGWRECPACHEHYGPDYQDEFCKCGSALEAAATPATGGAPPGRGPESSTGPAAPTLANRPPAGTLCLVVYSSDRKPMLYLPIDKDVTLIGRSDPVRGDFPDLDLSALLEPDAARRISRKHAVLLRSRENGTYTLRPLVKNTGTQIEHTLAEDLKDYPLSEGTRIVLGGSVRMKFETVR